MKKRLSVFLAVLMLVGTAFTVQAASFTDTPGKSCETAASVLNALGIVEGKSEGVFAPEDALTRAEMATLVLRTVGMDSPASGRDIFTDVPSSHWAYSFIAAAYQMGIVNGTSADTFTPDGVVTYEQAVKMVVAALGYTVQAEAQGGYPTGYLSKAAQLDILGGVKIGGDMTRGDMALLLYNALDVPLLQKTGYGENEHTYTDAKEETILSYYQKVTLSTDAVAVTPMASKVDPAPSVLKDEIITEKGVRMLKGESDAQNLLGVRADIYTRMDEITDKPVIIAIVPRASSSVTDIPVQNIDMGRTDKNTVVFEDADGKEHKTDITGATLVYNGRVKAMEDATISGIDIGTVRLVENAGKVDVVICESFENYIVESVNKETDTVYFKDGKGSLKIDFTDNAKAIVMTDEKGKALSLDDVAEWDVLSVAANGDVLRIYRSYLKASGAITEISEDTVVIGDKTYPIAKSMNKALLAVGKDAAYYLDFTGAIAAMDDSYSAKWSYGWLKLVAPSKGINAVQQLKIFCEDGTWKVFTLADRLEFNGTSATPAEVIAPDTETGNDVYKNGHAPKLYDAEGKFIPQLIAYEANEADEITVLHTAENLTDTKTYKDEDKFGGTFSMDFYAGTAGEGKSTPYSGGYVSRFNGTSHGESPINAKNETVANIYFGRVVKNDKTKIFVIPSVADDEKLYSMRTSLGMETWRTTDCISFYDVSEEYICGAMVVRNDLSAGASIGEDFLQSDAVSGIVLGISTVLDEDGFSVPAIRLKSYTGAEVTATLKDTEIECTYNFANADLAKDTAWKGVSPKDSKKTYNFANYETLPGGRTLGAVKMTLPVTALEPGDVIQYKLDDYGNLEAANVCFRANYGGGVEFISKVSDIIQSIAVTHPNNTYDGGALVVHGNVNKVLDAGILVDVNIADNKGQKTVVTAKHMMKKTGAFYLWDRDKQSVRAIEAGDVMPNDEVFVIWATENQRMFIVYRPTNPEVWKK